MILSRTFSFQPRQNEGLRKYYKGLQGAKLRSKGFSIKHLLNRTPDNYEKVGTYLFSSTFRLGRTYI